MKPYMARGQRSKIVDNYKNAVIKALQDEFGKSFEWAEWAVSQIDLAHYWRKCFASELADRIVAFESCLHLL